MIKDLKEKLNINVINVFGSNEGTTLSSCPQDMPDPEMRARYFPRYGVEGFGWANRVSARMRTKLRDQNTGEIITTPGKLGELCIMGPAVFDGYFNDQHNNIEAFDSKGFFRTGDLFEIAGKAHEYYRFVGRSKDLIVRGGMNISPDELDGLLDNHPAIAEAAVVGYPDEIFNERIAVVAVPMPGNDLNLSIINEYLLGKGLERFKLPEKLAITDALPRSSLNKVLRNNLTDLL